MSHANAREDDTMAKKSRGGRITQAKKRAKKTAKGKSRVRKRTKGRKIMET
jgi:hypothetical protein